MKTFLNKLKTRLLPFYAVLSVFAGSITLVCCDKDDLEIQNDFPFEVQVMPVPKDIIVGQTVEMRFTIQPSGNFTGTQYFIRYFQYDGNGTLKYYSEPAYLPNDLYSLPSQQFRLYYTSASTVSQSFDVWISDNFGNEKQLSFEFNSSD